MGEVSWDQKRRRAWASLVFNPLWLVVSALFYLEVPLPNVLYCKYPKIQYNASRAKTTWHIKDSKNYMCFKVMWGQAYLQKCIV
jgi:hypothetical protein